MEQLHQRLCHVGQATIRRTIPAVEGVSLSKSHLSNKCEPCELGKSIRGNTPKLSNTELEVLEVVESDIQGPFPVIAFDGTKENVKFIDSKSGYCKMETIPNGEANTVLHVFKRFKARMERRTGKKIKNIRTDDGSEFKKEFLGFVEEHGIVKQKGLPYRHNHPGKAERAHRTIMNP